jgi:glycosyltransferase involved in cell wall biosynthesis
MGRNPSISVIIPVYNRANRLALTIESVLKQTLPSKEIIVVDDGSTDDTAQVVAGIAKSACIPIRYVYQDNQGPSAARNTGLSLAQGDYIAFQDSDDCWTLEKTRIQLSLMHNYPNSVAVKGAAAARNHGM